MESLRQRSRTEAIESATSLQTPCSSFIHQGGQLYIPLVAAAWCFTAARSRLNSLSTAHGSLLCSELLNRRGTSERTGAGRRPARCERRRILRWGNMAGERADNGGVGGFLEVSDDAATASGLLNLFSRDIDYVRYPVMSCDRTTRDWSTNIVEFD